MTHGPIPLAATLVAMLAVPAAMAPAAAVARDASVTATRDGTAKRKAWGTRVPGRVSERRAKRDHSQVDAELAADLVGWAQRLSGRASPAGAALPELQPLPDDELARTVCPQQPHACRGIVAAYDTTRRRIVYRMSLDMRDPTDQSFIVHELMHWLQHLQRGHDLERSCESVLVAEREAYAVQSRYLERFKQWQRVGEILRFTFCPQERPEHAQADEPTVRFDASTGPITLARGAPTAPATRP